MKHVGVEVSPITVPYPVYLFEYVSAGGNSSQRTTVTLNTPTIDALIELSAEDPLEKECCWPARPDDREAAQLHQGAGQPHLPVLLGLAGG